MSKAVVVDAFGGPEVLTLAEQTVAPPGAGEVQVRHDAIGLNFIDVYHRTGLYPNPLPFTPGQEAAGTVIAIGDGVTGISKNDRVAYYGAIGAYAEVRNINADALIPIPDGISADVAAAIMLKGMTACYLITKTWAVQKGETIIVHAAAGGVGQLAVQWAKFLGATVIGTVGSADKAEIARAIGADHIINIREEDVAARVHEITGGRGVDVVYDSIGKDMFTASLACLRPRGLMVSFGNSSGPVTVPNLGVLASGGSLYVTRPTLAHYFSDRDSQLAGAAELFDLVERGVLKVAIGQEFKLANIAQAHIALESRQTTGATIIRP